MARTKGELISDIELRLTRGNPSSDIELERSQIAYWLDMARDKIVMAKINSSLFANEPVDPTYISHIPCQVADLEASSCAYKEGKRYSFTISKSILPLDNDMGIVRIVTNTGKILNRSTYDEIEYMYNLRFSKPSRENMFWYREGNNIFIEGISQGTKPSTKFNIFIIESQIGAELSDDDIYIIGDDIVEDVLVLAEEIGLRQIYGEFEDRSQNEVQPPE